MPWWSMQALLSSESAFLKPSFKQGYLQEEQAAIWAVAVTLIPNPVPMDMTDDHFNNYLFQDFIWPFPLA